MVYHMDIPDDNKERLGEFMDGKNDIVMGCYHLMPCLELTMEIFVVND